jgi:S-DNA-T family DNA segregation ATPase FtsK/SpoIIIE
LELLLRASRPATAAVDVRVDVDPDQPTARLAAALAAMVPADEGDRAATLAAPAPSAPALLHVRTGRLLDPDEPVGRSGVLSGDELVLDPETTPAPLPPLLIRAVSVDVLAGPDSGHSAVLDRGAYLLGRDPACDLVVSDPTVSRTHLRIEVAADWSVTIEAAGPVENGVAVNDEPVTGPRTVVGDDVVTLGATRIAIREFLRAADEVRDQLGQVEFHRTPYRPEVVRERTFEPLGPVPQTPEPRRFQALAALAPLAAGLAMFAFSGQPQFLVLTLLSPLAIVANHIEERRSGRSRQAAQVRRFRERLGTRVDDVAAARAAERVERVRSAPDLADLARRAELRTIDLWPRGRHADDFLRVRIGLGETASLVQAPVEANGDDALRDEAVAALAGHDRLAGVPVTLPLAEVGVLGVHGDPGDVDDVAASLLVQISCLHSPEDLIVAGAVGADRSFTDWLKWLPHVRSVTSPLAGRHLTTTAAGARRLLAELVEVAEWRAAGRDRDRDHDRRWPWLLVVLDGDLEPDATLVSQLLDRCPDAGISVVWLSTSEARVPHQAAAVVDCQLTRGDGGAVLWRTDPDVEDQRVELGRVHPEVADRVARALAPVRDATVATSTTAIPRTAPLLSVLGVDGVPDHRWVTARWLTGRPYGLRHAIGLGADGVFTLDLVADGPHALVGGTSGAGKSELLQAMVASLITEYPPNRLTFLFVDYKGGASSTAFRDVPHTVGYVTNLDAELARRALTSLRAELDRRMRILEGRAKDLEEMLDRHPEDAPPSLVIVVDEFATLVKEIPEFVAGIVDIAQRGRSLGIHLVLATQRPAGSVNDNILANTNLRLSLRMLDAADSAAVIRSPEAADIPVPLRGRGFARLGPRELVPFQSAYAGAPLVATGGEGAVVVAPFTIEPTGQAPIVLGGEAELGAGGDEGRATHLDAVVAAVVRAAELGGYERPRAPWKDVLPDHLTLAALRADERGREALAAPGRLVRVGLVDDPERQDQYPAVVDLEEGGGLVVYGSGGSGRTTLLRTLAASAALDAPPDDLVVFALDFASRSLRSIEALPHVAAVGTGDDLEAVTRVIALLAGELERRRALLADAQAETLTAYLGSGRHLPRLLLLVDGYPNLAAAFTGGGYSNPLDQWLDQFHRVVLDGRQVGIHTVLTADRRGAVPALLQSAIANRLVLRQADEGGYGDHGIPLARARALDLAPGRGLWQADLAVQVACVAEAGDGPAQAAALAEQGAEHRRRSPQRGPAIRTAPLPDVVDVAPEDVGRGGLAAVLGVADLTLAPVTVDLDHSHLLVAGLPRSGRSTAARIVAEGLQGRGVDVWAVGPPGSPLADLPGASRAVVGRAEAIRPVLDELVSLLETFPGAGPRLLVVDDLDAMDDSLGDLWERLAKADDLRVVATIETRNVGGFSMNALLNEVRKARRSLFLQPDDPVELFQATGVKPPVRPGTPMPPGRGVLLVDRRPTLVQVARTVGSRPRATVPTGAD